MLRKKKLNLRRRLLSMLLAFALLPGSVPGALSAAAETPAGNAKSETVTGTDAAGLPQAGQVVNGFETMETRDFPLMDATAVRFVHQKTGAELYYIANDDTNRVFDLTFFTEALDKTGLPHVFEHAVLSGSEKYPSAQLFSNLSHQTYNTYMNAVTYSGYTTYPVASLSEAQLLKFADYYVDSCLHPMVLKNEKIFRTEAWRYRLDDADAPLTIEGTVYSEMLGAWTLEENAYNNAIRAMFPGSKACNEQGGDPDYIPDLTWQMLKDYHAKYYHPSNCCAYLYGRFEDYAAFLELLDGYFSAYEKKEFSFEDSGYKPITEPVVLSLPFPLEEGSSTENASVIFYGFVCPGLRNDLKQELVINTLTDLFADDSSDLQQSFQKALPYGTFERHRKRNPHTQGAGLVSGSRNDLNVPAQPGSSGRGTGWQNKVFKMLKKLNSQVDLIGGPIMKNLLIFMLPILISIVFQLLYSAVDTAIVGHFLGEQSLAAVGANVAIFDLMVMFAQALGNGLCIVVSRAFGAGDESRMRKSVAGSLVIGTGTIVVMTILSMLGLGPLLRLLGTPESIYAEALAYIRIIGGGIVVMFAYNLLSSLLRAIGNSAITLAFLIISSILNIILDIVLVAGAGMGVQGAAAATVIAQGISAAFCAAYILKRTPILIPRREDFSFDRELYLELAGQGYSMAFMGSVVNLGSVVLQYGINSLGPIVIAGHTTARKLFMMCILPYGAMGMAIATFVSQNKGAGQRERIIRGVRQSYVYDLVCGVLSIIIMFLFADELAVLISGSTNPELIGNTVAYVRFAAVFCGVLGVLHQTRHALQGLGAKFTPVISSFIELAGKCLFAWLFVPQMGYRAVIVCEPLIWCLMGIYLVIAFFINPYIRGKSGE